MTKPRPTALITGAAIRVGRGIAISLAEKGYNIALHYNTSKHEAEETAKTIRALGVECTLYKAELTETTSAKEMVAKVKQDFPSLNLLVNNASIFERISFKDTRESDFDRHMDINFKAPFFLTQAFAEMVEKGNIINLLDTYILFTNGGYFAYLLSKKALHELTRMAARELAPGIRVNAIAIGMTELNDNLDQSYISKRLKELPLHSEVSIEDITRTLHFLLEHKAMTGECIFVDYGGHLL